jgi:hypothetical protein
MIASNIIALLKTREQLAIHIFVEIKRIYSTYLHFRIEGRLDSGLASQINSEVSLQKQPLEYKTVQQLLY